MPSKAENRAVTPRLLELVISYVQTGSTEQTARDNHVSVETVRSALVTARQRYRDLGYTNLGNQIGLRTALRHHGDINHLKPI